MGEYSSDLNTNLYKYSRPVYITEPTGERQTFIPLALNLNETNFNFDTARSDGLDFRLAERSNGTGVLQMWVSYWDDTTKKATVWFKLPEILAGEMRTLYAFWGYAHDSGISDLTYLLGENPVSSGSVSTPVFTFGDDFNAASLDANKWPTNTGGYSISDSKINLVTGAWIRSPQVLGGQNTTYVGAEYEIITTAGMYGNHQHTGNCYLSYTGALSFSMPALIDDIVDAQSSTYAYVASIGGCALGVDLGEVKEKISKVRIYFYNYTETYNGDLEWASTAYINVFKTHTNETGDQSLVYTYTYTEMPIYKAQDYVWYADLIFDAPGIETRYLHFYGASNFIGTSTIRWSEIDVFGDESNIIRTTGNFIVEEGIIGIGSPSSTSVAAHRYRFYGGENRLGINYFWEGATDRTHDFVYAGTYSTYNGTNKGLELASYSHNYIAYYETTDRVYQSMNNRANYPDYEDSWERKVHRNTEVSNFRIYGEGESSANGVEIDWVIARDFTPESDPVVDYTALYVEYEYVGHQQLDYTEYASDVTSVDFHHLSGMAGDPYRMSDNVTNSISNIFISDGSTTSGSLIIDFGRGRYSVTDNNYIHLDNGHVEYYNASKLSDSDTDIYDRDYWQGTTTSGWAAIQFPTTKDIACLTLIAVSGSTDKMVKNFIFYGSQSDPRFSGWNDKVIIYEGSARAVEEEQTFYFSTGLTFYEYYILEVLDTHGSNVAIQEWGMYERVGFLGKKVISQLRLHPAAFDSNEYYFVKEIEFYGSNDGFNWDLLIANTDTPTPFTDYAYGRWSRYSFDNFNTYYLYKLTCYDNWRAANDQIKIAEWEMVERVEEANSVRILAGSTNDINNIWADPTTTINSGTLYMTNDALNTIEYEKLIQYTVVSGVDDFNVKL